MAPRLPAVASNLHQKKRERVARDSKIPAAFLVASLSEEMCTYRWKTRYLYWCVYVCVCVR